jgi:hypothetical protein
VVVVVVVGVDSSLGSVGPLAPASLTQDAPEVMSPLLPHPPRLTTQVDLEYSIWLTDNGVPFTLVFTKTDKRKKGTSRSMSAKESNMVAFKRELLKVRWSMRAPAALLKSARSTHTCALARSRPPACPRTRISSTSHRRLRRAQKTGLASARCSTSSGGCAWHARTPR